MEKQIFSLEHAAMERWRQGDPWRFISLNAEDIIYIDPYQVRPIIGLTAYTELMRQLENNIHYQKSEFVEPQVTIIGNAAILTYNYRSSVLSSEGGVISQTPWNTTEVYFLQDKEWQIAHTHWSYIHQVLPEKVEIPVNIFTSCPTYEDILAELMTIESVAMERWRKGDPYGFIEISAPEVTYFDTGTPSRINGREALRAEYQRREGKIFYDVMEFIDPRVQVCGDVAVLTYRFLSTNLKPDGSIESRIPWNCTEVFKYGGEGWRIIHTHWSFIYGMLHQGQP